MFRTSIIALVSGTVLIACSAAPVDSTETGSTDEELRAPACKTVDDCNTAFEHNKWQVPSSKVDQCIQNHDFAYVCMACTNHRCTFHPGF
jgi:hypothetical protein